jgi:tRNA U34 5-methylaminomethyl-2-thiouridine-forming methyltransferase MnmC
VLLKIHQTLQEVELMPSSFDLVYFDAFAPTKQPEMWEFPVLEKVTQAMGDNSLFVTYCAKGQLKRDLRNLGLQVETLSGPPGKKEMVRAIKS